MLHITRPAAAGPPFRDQGNAVRAVRPTAPARTRAETASGQTGPAVVPRAVLEHCASALPPRTAALWLARGAALGRLLKKVRGAWLEHRPSGTAPSS